MEEIEKINSNYNYSYNRIKEALNKLKDLIDEKQSELTAGDNITIADGVISATDTKYTAGDNISISEQNVISATDTDNYNDLSNKPIRNQDLDDAEFVPVANTYYRHTGASATTYTIGAIYYYDGTNFNLVGAVAGGKMYRHSILLYAGSKWITATIINSSNVAFTEASFKTFLDNNGYKVNSHTATLPNTPCLEVSGFGINHYTDYDMYIYIFGIVYDSGDIRTVEYSYNQQGNQTETLVTNGSLANFYRDIVKEI